MDEPVRVITDRGPGVLVGELPGPPHSTVVMVKLDRGPLVFRPLGLVVVVVGSGDANV